MSASRTGLKGGQRASYGLDAAYEVLCASSHLVRRTFRLTGVLDTDAQTHFAFCIRYKLAEPGPASHQCFTYDAWNMGERLCLN